MLRLAQYENDNSEEYISNQCHESELRICGCELSLFSGFSTARRGRSSSSGVTPTFYSLHLLELLNNTSTGAESESSDKSESNLIVDSLINALKIGVGCCYSVNSVNSAAANKFNVVKSHQAYHRCSICHAPVNANGWLTLDSSLERPCSCVKCCLVYHEDCVRVMGGGECVGCGGEV